MKDYFATDQWAQKIVHIVISGMAGVAVCLPLTAHAVGTIAGTDILNTAEVSYEVAGTPQTTTSNAVVITVAEILDVDVTLLSGQVSVLSGATLQELLFSVTNTGNGSESFLLSINNALGGDDFDPLAAAPFAIYFDTDGSGDFSVGDIAYTAGSNDPVLAADQVINILLVNDIPALLADGLTGLSELGADAITGTGAPGDRFPGAGDGGVDAVAGTSGADDVAAGEYIIGAVQMTVVKSATVTDPSGGTDPVPGAEITYRIVITPGGSDTATAAVFNDQVPTSTTYLPGSIRLNAGVLTDIADADDGAYSTTPVPAIAVNLGDLTSASGTQTIEFTVTID